MGIFNKQKRLQMPNEILEIASELSEGQMMPLNTGMTPSGERKPFISFIIKESDEAIEKIGIDPIMEFTPGLINFNVEKEIWLLIILVRIAETPEFTYDTSFSYFNPEVWSDYQILYEQKQHQCLICGEEKNTAIVYSLDDYFIQKLHAFEYVIKKSLKTEWNDFEYKMAMRQIHEIFSSNAHLWDVFQENDGIIILK